jgi:hypothetical protein
MTAISQFNDFMAATGPAVFSGPEKMINEALERTYLMAYLLKGKPMSMVLQGGSKIFDEAFFDEKSTARNYHPNETFSWSMPQVLDEWEAPWRFTVDHMAWTIHERLLQGTKNMTKGAKHQVYKKLKKICEMRMWTSKLNFMESQLTAIPSTADMESATGKDPYSMLCFINENTNGIPLGFSTLMGIDQSTKAEWRCQKETYADDTSYSASSFLFAAFDRMYRKLKWQSLPGKAEFGAGTSGKGIIPCSLNGITHYSAMLRASNDNLVSAQDPSYTEPKFAGKPLVYIASLDGAKFNDGGTYKTEVAHTLQGGRYHFLATDHMHSIFHEDRYMVLEDPMRAVNQPFTWVQPCDTWWNLIADSVQRHGIVAPSAAQSLGPWA